MSKIEAFIREHAGHNEVKPGVYNVVEDKYRELMPIIRAYRVEKPANHPAWLKLQVQYAERFQLWADTHDLDFQFTVTDG